MKNTFHIVDIAGMTHEGLGVAKIDGYTVFVEGALEGEKVHIKIIKAKKNYGIGKLLKIIETSQSRKEPFCDVYKRCGGCSLQHMDYQAQLDFKENVVRENLRRIGGLEIDGAEGAKIHKTIGMEDPFRYRNKAQFPVAYTGKEIVTGFYAKRSHEVVDSSSCAIQDPLADKTRLLVKKFIKEKGLSVYDELSGKGLIRHIMTRTAFQSGELMVVLVINGDELPYKEELINLLTGEMKEIKSIILNVNKKKTNVILGNKSICIYGSQTIQDSIGQFKFNISPLSFFQVNPIQTEVLYKKALEYSGLSGEETVLDIYCGIGTISLFLSQKAKKVIGIESVADAVDDARENTRLNDVDNIEFIEGKAEEVILDLYDRGVKAVVAVVDPPRKGCDEVLLKTLADMQPERIVYVSCNPATLARDLKYLEASGYKTKEVQPVDMFPWSYHVETIARIQRIDS
jgi:23S rRNA (uracil1939-C5)-methyltransferase